MKWRDATEIVLGFVLAEKLSPDAVNPDDCAPPYGEMIPILRDGGTKSDVVSKHGYSDVQTAIEASESVNGDMKPIEWLKVLKTAAVKATTPKSATSGTAKKSSAKKTTARKVATRKKKT